MIEVTLVDETNETEINAMEEFAADMNSLRRRYSQFAKEIDKCLFDVGRSHLRSCGEANCGCQISFAKFHAERNRVFKTTSEVRKHEFN